MGRFAIQKSFMQRKEDVVREWFHVDASGEVLGRMATRIASILMGKHKPTYTPHVDCGDGVVVTHASLVQLTGKKRQKKLYYHHTGYIGGLRSETMDSLMKRKPEKVIRLAVRRMLPKSKLGKKMLKKLKIHAGAEHTNEAQKPQKIEFGTGLQART